MDVLRMLNLIFCFLYKIELEIGQVACCCLAEAWNGQHTMKHDAILADRPIPHRGHTVDTSHPGALQRTVLTQGPYRGQFSSRARGPIVYSITYAATKFKARTRPRGPTKYKYDPQLIVHVLGLSPKGSTKHCVAITSLISANPAHPLHCCISYGRFLVKNVF